MATVEDTIKVLWTQYATPARKPAAKALAKQLERFSLGTTVAGNVATATTCVLAAGTITIS